MFSNRLGAFHLIYLLILGLLWFFIFKYKADACRFQKLSQLDESVVNLIAATNDADIKRCENVVLEYDDEFNREYLFKMWQADSCTETFKRTVLQKTNSLNDLKVMMDSLQMTLRRLMNAEYAADNLRLDEILDNRFLNTSYNNNEILNIVCLKSETALTLVIQSLATRLNSWWFSGNGFEPFLISPQTQFMNEGEVQIDIVSSSWQDFHAKVANDPRINNTGRILIDTVFNQPGNYPLALKIIPNLPPWKVIQQNLDTVWVQVKPE